MEEGKVIMFGVEPVWLVLAVGMLLVFVFGWGVITRPFGIGRDKDTTTQPNPPKDTQ
jgi:hypothetical protein